MKKVIIIAPDTADEVRRGLLRTTNGQWLHVSRTRETVILRSLLDPSAAQLTPTPGSLGDALGGATFVPYDVLRWYLDPRERIPGRVSHKETEYWRSLAERFGEDPALWVPPQVSTTELRRYYESLRASPGLTAKDCADAARDATRLGALFATAVEQLAPYRNLREGWAPENARKRMDASSFSRDMALRLGKCELAAPIGLEYVYVERELAPLRATGAEAPGSGDGGIDVLLASDDESCLPIVVEVKSESDRSAYLALVQSLTYASELVTRNQRHRLAKFYPRYFSGLHEALGPFADIWIVEEVGKRDPQLEQTRQVAEQLLKDSAISGLLRRISFFESEHGNGGLVPVVR